MATESMIESVVIVGAGRVAHHVGSELGRRGISIRQIVNRSEDRGRRLARKLRASYSNNLDEIDRGADLYLFAVSDDALTEMAKIIRLPGSLVVHLSGSIPLEVLRPVSERSGVFYPLQTFTGKHKVQFRSVPICIEAARPDDQALLVRLASKISEKVFQLNGEQRALAHLAAVISCNFTNYLYSVSYDLLQESGLSMDLLKPLIAQTAANIGDADPFLHQTGPAYRNDTEVIRRHLAALRKNRIYQGLYEHLTTEIINRIKLHG